MKHMNMMWLGACLMDRNFKVNTKSVLEEKVLDWLTTINGLGSDDVRLSN